MAQERIGGKIHMTGHYSRLSQKAVSVFLFTIIVVSAFTCSFAASAGSNGIVVKQTKIVFEADKDEGKSTQFGVRNNGNEEMIVKIEKADFFIADNGAFQVKEAGSTPSSANSFITCKESEFEMKPGENVNIDVTLNPGMQYLLPEYSSTILVRYISKKTNAVTANIKTYTQVAITLRVISGSKMKNDIDTSKPPLKYMDVVGKRFMGYGGKKEIRLSLKNVGLLTVEPKVQASVYSIFSGRIEDLPKMEGYVMPGQMRTYITSVNSTSIFDIRTIKFEYEYQYAGKAFKDKLSFSYLVLSYQLVIGLLFLIAGIIWIARNFRKRNKLLKQLLEQNQAMAEAAAKGMENNHENLQHTENNQGH